ncbi:MucR family transcriptional regulator [Acidisoma sp.]|uniref:MucR family transcriptional regulator n=1 Tax=Acidisoma sp. TaxID=1872115 RepID=UPI003B003E79
MRPHHASPNKDNSGPGAGVEEVLARDLTGLTAWVVASFVSRNPIAAQDLPQLIKGVFAALAELEPDRTGRPSKPNPAVPIDQSVTHDYIVCLEDGQHLKTLKRYLWRKYALSPEQYRSRWQLPDDYPLIAPAYTALRSRLARRR